VYALTDGQRRHEKGVGQGERAVSTRKWAGALLFLTDPLVLEPHRHHVAALALQSGLPAIYPWRMYAEAGGLMSYGISLREWYRRAATYVENKAPYGRTRRGDIGGPVHVAI